MKSVSRYLVLLVALLLVPISIAPAHCETKGQVDTPPSHDTASSSGMKAEVVSVLITKGTPASNDSEKYDLQASGSIALDLLIQSPYKQILDLIEDDSKITQFSDDQGTNLLEGEHIGFNPHVAIGRDFSSESHQCSVMVVSPRKPASKTQKVHLSANLAFRCAGNETITESKRITPSKGSSFTLGDSKIQVSDEITSTLYDMHVSFEPAHPLTQVSEERIGVPFDLNMQSKSSDPSSPVTSPQNATNAHGKPQQKGFVTFRSDSPLDIIKSIRFLGPDGKSIKHSPRGSSYCSEISLSDDPPKAAEYTKTYELDRKVDILTAEITYYKKIEKVVFPVTLDFGLGL